MARIQFMNNRYSLVFAVMAAFILVGSALTPRNPALAQEENADQVDMTIDRLFEIAQRIDEDATREENAITLTLRERTLFIVADPNADRMRILVPISSAENITPDLMKRLLQANYDSALDARYALGRNIIWGTFIHPLSPLRDDQFLSAVGQTFNVADSFGSSYSSGELVYGGGDSNEIRRKELIEELKDLLKKKV